MTSWWARAMSDTLGIAGGQKGEPPLSTTVPMICERADPPLPSVTPRIPLLGACLVGLVELAAHIPAKQVPGATRAEAPALDVLGIAPQEVAHGAIVGDLAGEGGRISAQRCHRASKRPLAKCGARLGTHERPTRPCEPGKAPPLPLHLLLAVYGAYLVERRDCGGQAPVDAEYLVVDDGAQAEGRVQG